LQVLKYTEGTFYHPHHDTITDQIHSWAGPRMLNAFIYFNDKPNGGGETEFTMLEPPLKVKPAVGRMVLWASQMDDDSLVVDHRATHQACNVTDGTKEAANLWVHLYDFQTPSTMGC
jgi:predicted 2-oxoglutarate/Fe(II)-dependent dioxygenase YbiX